MRPLGWSDSLSHTVSAPLLLCFCNYFYVTIPHTQQLTTIPLNLITSAGSICNTCCGVPMVPHF